jgi:hypothetical protein
MTKILEKKTGLRGSQVSGGMGTHLVTQEGPKTIFTAPP